MAMCFLENEHLLIAIVIIIMIISIICCVNVAWKLLDTLIHVFHSISVYLII